MDVVRQFTNRCACGWEFRGTADEVVDATIDHGRRIHNMEATREQVLDGIGADPGDATVARGAAGETEAAAG
jgi:predicted small metal-binding protein